MGNILQKNDVADIALVAQGFKPAAMLEITYFKNSKITKREFSKQVNLLKKMLKNLNLQYKMRINYPMSKNELTQFSIIARNQKIIKKILVAEKEKNPVTRRLQIGQLMGYPKTAVNAFAKDKSITISDLPMSIQKNRNLKFLNFRLSKNWRNEIKYLNKRVKILKKLHWSSLEMF